MKTNTVTQDALENLIHCIQHWAEAQTNPVIDLLDNHDLVTNIRYPEPALSCSNNLLRVFYHYHEQPFQFNDEHGHFHYFVKCTESKWSHVAGLCMDSQGQPFRWFTVNHWVTGAKWLNSETLVRKISLIPANNEKDSPLQLWLVSIFLVFKDIICKLLLERDEKIKTLQNNNNLSISELHQNRDFYILSEHSFDLYTHLSQYLD